MTPEQRAKKVTKQWVKDSNQYAHKKVGLKALIAKAIKKAEAEIMRKPTSKALVQLVERYRGLISDSSGAVFPENEKCAKEHLMELCDRAIEGIRDGSMPYGKLSRWIGFIQGILCASGVTTVDRERDFTRSIFQSNEG